MKRRDFLKIGILATLTAAGIDGLLRLYRAHTGADQIIEYIDPILRRIAASVETTESFTSIMINDDPDFIPQAVPSSCSPLPT